MGGINEIRRIYTQQIWKSHIRMDSIYINDMRIDIFVYPTRSIHDPTNYREQASRSSNNYCGVIGFDCWWDIGIYDWCMAVGFIGSMDSKHIHQPRINWNRHKADVQQIWNINNSTDGGNPDTV